MVAIEEEIPGSSVTADPAPEQQPETIKEDEALTEESLRYLGFIHLATLQAIVYFSRIYVYARENSGPLKPGVDTIEGAVKTVISPVYDKFHQVPYDLLKSVDHKVEEAINQIPPSVKKAPEVAKSVTTGIHRSGVVSTATDLAKNMVTFCEPVAEECAVGAWKALHRLPLFPQAAQVAVPTVARLSEKYNSAVCRAADQGISMAAFLPLVPTSKISKIFGNSSEE